MKAHIVTHNLFSHTFDRVVNGNTLIFLKNIFFSVLMVTFFINRGVCASNYAYSGFSVKKFINRFIEN
jgi:hypothetical protein